MLSRARLREETRVLGGSFSPRNDGPLMEGELAEVACGGGEGSARATGSCAAAGVATGTG